MNKIRIYEIRLHGYLHGDWQDWFGPMTLRHLPDGDMLLCGPLDQTALFGLLTHLRDLGLVLLSLNTIAPHAPAP